MALLSISWSLFLFTNGFAFIYSSQNYEIQRKMLALREICGTADGLTFRHTKNLLSCHRFESFRPVCCFHLILILNGMNTGDENSTFQVHLK